MRPLTFEEREDLVRRADSEDILCFIWDLQILGRKHKMSHMQLLSVLLHAPKPTDIPEGRLLQIRTKLAEEGTELTPAEVTETMEIALCKIRNYMRDCGHSIPDSDVELLKLCARLS